LPHDALAGLAHRWGVTLEGAVRESQTGRVCFGRRGDAAVVLKVPNPDEDEANSLTALLHFGGHGAVRVLEHESGAMLLERAIPGSPLTDLVTCGRDDDATGILCAIVADLHRPTLSPDVARRFPTVEDWGNELDSYRGRAGLIPPDLIERAIAMFAKLTGSQGERRLLHGDLHHHNIFYDGRRGWVAIDPKGVVGEGAYEIGAALRNPTDDPARFAVPSIIERRIGIVCGRLGYDPDRVLGWAFAQGVLSAIWRLADGRDPNRGLATAQAILPMLRSR
jgi:streptomycin 6-kinase